MLEWAIMIRTLVRWMESSSNLVECQLLQHVDWRRVIISQELDARRALGLPFSPSYI